MTRDWWGQLNGLAFEGTNGAYTLGELIGIGGFGAVFSATSRRSTAPVAVKLIVPGADEFDAQFRELVRGLQIRHRSLVQCLDCGTFSAPQGRFLYMAMELASGTLEEVLNRNPLPAHEVPRVALAVASGLAYLHQEHNLVHRDLKPGNVLWVAGEWKLADYGVARTVDTHSGLQTSRVVGTVDYMPPESFNGLVSPAWDVWAFGVMMAQILTGRKPFAAGSQTEVMGRIVLADPDLTGVPAAWLPLIRSCLQRDPAKRPTAATLVAQIPPYVVETPLPSSVDPVPAPVRAPEKPQRRWLKPVAAAAGILIAIAGLAYYFWIRIPEPAEIQDAVVASDTGDKIERETYDYARAIRYYDRALELAGNKDGSELIIEAIRLRRASARYYARTGCEGVIEDFSYAIARHGDGGASEYELRGECYLETGKKQEALADFGKVMESKDSFWIGQALPKRAKLLEDLGRKREALSDWKAYLALHPEIPDAKEAVARLSASAKD